MLFRFQHRNFVDKRPSIALHNMAKETKQKRIS